MLAQGNKMGQAASDLSGEDNENQAQPTLGISETLRRRGVIINLDQQPSLRRRELNEDSTSSQGRSSGRSTGGGRYNLRVSKIICNNPVSAFK